MDSSKKYDNPNPGASANTISKLLFWWTLPIFKLGLKTDLDIKDLHNPLKGDFSEPLGNQLETNWNKELASAKKNGRKPKLLRALIKTFWFSCSIYGVLLVINAAVIKVAQPLILRQLIRYFNRTNDVSKSEAYLCASAVVLLSIMSILIMHHCFFGQIRIGMRCRIACCSLVYRKLLRLSRLSLSKTTAGQLVNLLSNDVNRFDFGFVHLHFIWIMPIQAIVSAYFMYDIIGASAFTGLFFITMQAVPLQGYLSRYLGRLRMKIAMKTDERVRLMNEIVSGIQVIKMYAWEQPFEKLVELARKYEIDLLTIASYIRGFSLALMVFTERTVLYLTLVTYVLLGNQLSGDIVFSLAQFFNNVQLYMAIFFPIAIVMLGEAKVSVKRLETFLMLEDNPKLIQEDLISNMQNEGEIVVKKVRASWTPHSITDTLNNIDITIKPGMLCAIVGPVGAGKTSFLQLLLGELIPQTGAVHINGSVSYASQEPWLFVSSVRNNILFGQPYIHNRYKRVVEICALQPDFEQLPYGDKTLVSERGVSLSGGQRARINLARAIYRSADIYLFDDPLSAVDTQVSKHLFHECISDFLSNKTRILVTHQVQFLPNVDLIILINNGQIEKIGTYDQLSNDLIHILPKSDEDEPREKPKEKAEYVRKRLTSIQSISTNTDDNEEEPEETQELMEKGAVSGSLYSQYMRAGGSIPFLLFLAFSLIIAQIASSGADYWVTYWTIQEETRHYTDILLNNNTILNNNNDTLINANGTTVSNFEDEFNNGTTLFETTTIFDDLNNITNFDYDNNTTYVMDQELYDNITETKKSLYSTNTCIYIYTVCIIGSILLTTLRSLVFYKLCMNASRRLHNKMFNNILQATMRFFDTNPSGRILNRFSKDMGTIDEILPRAMLEAIQIFLVMFGIVTMVILVNPWMILPVVVIAFIFYYVRVVYLATAQDVKRLEGITRSPVFSHVSASLDGITTIRASNAQLLLQKEFDSHQDLHTRASFLVYSTMTAFGFCLDIISVIFLAIVTFSFMLIDNSYSGNVGLAISQSLILNGMLQYGMKQTAEVLSQMTSVERILQYTKLEKEGPFESEPGKKPAKDWPQKGQVQFNQVYLRYVPTEAPVLNNLNFTIRPGQKVGIVGRTGAGKSSLISALFRLAPIDGNIYIDNIDTNSIGLNDLRTNISIIPQEPVLFSATLRHNLDPFKTRNDTDLWKALEEVELKDVTESLDRVVSEGGSNFSAGQRQLICLARAIIRNNKVLVLDEATANVDPQTDALVQKTIRNKFADCTVLTIAHRLNTVMDSEKVIVMDNGQIMEFGHPHVLLQNPNGCFANMLAQTGRAMEQTLRQIAKDAYEKMPKDLNDLQLELIDK